jgi:hypothetical protein
MPEIKSKAIEFVKTKDLIPYSRNMHKHSPEQIDRLISLIEYQGFRDPLIVQKGTNIIAAGHGRYLAAIKMGLREVPVIFQEFDNAAQFYAFVVSHNAIGKDAWAELDLSEVNNDIGDLGPDFDIDMLGLKDFSIDPLEKFSGQEDTEDAEDAEGKEFILEVKFPNEDGRDAVYNELLGRGLMVRLKKQKIKNKK